MKQLPYQYIIGHTGAQTPSPCLECGDPLPYGSRADRKFCSEKCRHEYHNGKRTQVRGVHLRIINAIEKNYRILLHLLELDCSSASLSDLLILGFRPEYMTSCTHDARFRECRCYEVSYRLTGQRIYELKRIPAELLVRTPPEEGNGK